MKWTALTETDLLFAIVQHERELHMTPRERAMVDYLMGFRIYREPTACGNIHTYIINNFAPLLYALP